MQFKRSGTGMDQSLDGGPKPKNTDSWGTKNIINPKTKNKLMKWMSTSVSHFSETDLNIRLVFFFSFCLLRMSHNTGEAKKYRGKSKIQQMKMLMAVLLAMVCRK